VDARRQVHAKLVRPLLDHLAAGVTVRPPSAALPHRIIGKGRRERVLPLWKDTAASLRAWLRVRGDTPDVAERFTNARGQPITRAGRRCPALCCISATGG
jgi:integrase